MGQGICGTMLSWFLQKEGKSFIVIDDDNEQASSRVAAGIINPVTGRRYAYAWMVDEVMDFALQTYRELGIYCKSKFIFPKSIIDFFPSAQMRNAFIDRLEMNDTYLHPYPDQNHFNQYFQYDFGCGEIKPAYIVHIQILLACWRKELLNNNTIIQEKFDPELVIVKKDFIQYKDITAKKIIFCDGAFSVSSRWFKLLPFAFNKGEVLIIECTDLTNEHIFKKGLMLVPLPVQNTFWVGSNYLWEFKDDQPTKEFLDHATTILNGWLKNSYKVLFHKASLRPATLERRPFAGFHPVYENVGILNGMGTKGTSLAPFFAHQLVRQMIDGFPIAPEADVHRFQRILSKEA